MNLEQIPNTTHQLFRTRLKLSGNYSLYTNGDKIKIDTLLDNASSSKLKPLSIAENGKFSQDLGNFFSAVANTPESAFEFSNFNFEEIGTEFDQQYDTRELSGLKNYNNPSKFGFFAPIWLTQKKIPSNFVIYRIPGDLDLNHKQKNTVSGKEFFYENILKNAELVRNFDLTVNSRLGRYIRQHVNSDLFRDYSIELINEESPYLSFNGISIKNPGFIQYNSSSRILNERSLARDFNRKIENVWSEQGICSSNLLNITFQFEEENTEEFYRYYGFYVNQEVSNIELHCDPYQFYSYDKRQQLTQLKKDSDFISLLESPRYYLNNGEYQNVSSIDHSQTSVTENKYLGFIKLDRNKYYNYTVNTSESFANLTNLSKTNLTSKKFIGINNVLPLPDLFTTLEVKFDTNNQVIYSPNGAFKRDFENCYLTVPNRHAASDYWKQPKIKKVLDRFTAIIEPKIPSLIKNYNQTFEIVISKPFVHGYFNPIPLRDFNLSLLNRENYNFELEYPETALSENLDNVAEEFFSAQNIFDALKEQDLLKDNNHNYPIENESLQWSSLDGTNTKNNFIPLYNSPQLGNYGFSPSSVLLKNERATEDKVRANPKRHTHEWSYIADFPTTKFNLLVRLHQYRKQEGKILQCQNIQDLNHPINQVKFMETGEEDITDLRTMLYRIPDDTGLSLTDIVNYFNLNQTTTIGKYNINFTSTIEEVGYGKNQKSDSYVYLDTISDVFLNNVPNDYTVFENINTDYFDQLFNIKEYNSFNGSKKNTLTNSKYSIFQFGSRFRGSTLWYKGFKVNGYQRVVGTGNTELSLNKARKPFNLEQDLNQYKFATIICQDNTLTEDYHINVIRNEAFKFIVIVLRLPNVPTTLTDFYTNRNLKRFSFSWLKNTLGRYQESTDQSSRSNLKTSFYTITENGNLVYDDFYININESSYFKTYDTITTEFYPREKWQKEIQRQVKDPNIQIGTLTKSINKTPTLTKISGNYFKPVKKNVLYYKEKVNNEPLYFDTDHPNFGIISDFKFRKIGNFKRHLLLGNISPESNILLSGRYQGRTFKFKQQEFEFKQRDLHVDYPKIGEVAYDYKDIYIFSPSWTFDFYNQYKKLSNTQRKQADINLELPGYISSQEVPTFGNSKFLNLPSQFQLPSFNTDLQIPTSSEENIRTLVGTFDLFSHFKSVLVERWINKDIFKNINLNLIEDNFGSINQYIESYIEKNIINQYRLSKLIVFRFEDVNTNGLKIHHPTFLPDNTNFDLTLNSYQNVIKENALTAEWPYELNELGNNNYQIRISTINITDQIFSDILTEARLNEIGDLSFAVFPVIKLKR